MDTLACAYGNTWLLPINMIIHNLIAVKHVFIFIELIYATPHNFTHQQLYPTNAQAYVQTDIIQDLYAAANDIHDHSLYVKIWDAYRPLSVQQTMWDLVPDERYVAHPSKGGLHTRGCAVDVTLCDQYSNNIAMPTEFDCFDTQAHATSFAHLDSDIQHNVQLLKTIMERHNFVQHPYEWWHFTHKNWNFYPVLDIPFDQITSH